MNDTERYDVINKRLTEAPTVACEIGKHRLCDGTAYDPDTDTTIPCSCPCHTIGN